MSALYAFTAAFGLSVCAILALRPVCVRFGHVDRPGGRKTHRQATPLSGGIAIAACVVALGCLVMPAQWYAGFALGALVLLCAGALDDRRPVSPLLRLSLQIFAVAVGMCAFGGVRLANLGSLFGSDDLLLGSLGTIFTVIAAVGVINAVNMIDGADGIAGSFAVVVSGVILVLGVGSSAVSPALLCLTIGSLLAFLMFNMRTPWQRQARCFLGDAGSMVLGYMLAWFAIAASQGDQAVFDPIAAVWLFGLPVADTNYLMGSRIARSKSPFEADNRHFHHLLQALGFTPQRALYVWLAVAGCFMAVAVVGQLLGISEGIQLMLFLLVFGLYCLAANRMWRLVVRRHANAQASSQPVDNWFHGREPVD